MFVLMSPMGSRMPMLMVAGLCMRMTMRMLVGVPVGMAFTESMLVRMTMLMFVLMRAFHNSSSGWNSNELLALNHCI